MKSYFLRTDRLYIYPIRKKQALAMDYYCISYLMTDINTLLLLFCKSDDAFRHAVTASWFYFQGKYQRQE